MRDTSPSPSRRRRRSQRRGATTLEVSLTLALFLVVTLGTADLCVGVVRYHAICQAARQGARRAIVHGARADLLGSWGPAAVQLLASANGQHDIVDGDGGLAVQTSNDGIRDLLIACDNSQTNIRVDWLDNSNEFEDRVRVTVTTPYQPILLFVFGAGPINLSASSTMLIAH